MIVSQINAMGGISSLWVGAFTEALLHPKITEILCKLGSVNSLDYWLITNGTKLTRDIIKTIISIPITRLRISLDAATPEKYHEIRGGNLQQVEENIDLFLEMRSIKKSTLPLLSVSFVEMPENKDEKNIFIQKWEKKADFIDIQTLQTFATINDDFLDTAVDSSPFKCTDPFKQLVIKHDGEIIPCCASTYKTDKPIYLNDIGIMEYWNSAFALDFADSIHNKRYSNVCKQCIASFAPVESFQS